MIIDVLFLINIAVAYFNSQIDSSCPQNHVYRNNNDMTLFS